MFALNGASTAGPWRDSLGQWQTLFGFTMAMHANVFDVPRPQDTTSQKTLLSLPLNLLSLIISHVRGCPWSPKLIQVRGWSHRKLDNVGDLAACCSAARTLNYMCQTLLYEKITLSSYDTIRYKDERPEGLGSSSPFAMGLNALVTRNVATLVRSLTLQGQWKEHDLQEFSSAGRVPDDAMMLNIAVRAAVDRCTGLESFKLVFERSITSR
jgi:hypothetical protein